MPELFDLRSADERMRWYVQSSPKRKGGKGNGLKKPAMRNLIDFTEKKTQNSLTEGLLLEAELDRQQRLTKAHDAELCETSTEYDREYQEVLVNPLYYLPPARIGEVPCQELVIRKNSKR